MSNSYPLVDLLSLIYGEKEIIWRTIPHEKMVMNEQSVILI